jgi:hypothetical protein
MTPCTTHLVHIWLYIYGPRELSHVTFPYFLVFGSITEPVMFCDDSTVYRHFQVTGRTAINPSLSSSPAHSSCRSYDLSILLDCCSVENVTGIRNGRTSKHAARVRPDQTLALQQ